jgi:hypothetical protein
MRSALGILVIRSLASAVCLACALAPLPGATLELLSINDMISKSTGIIRGRVIGSYSAFRGPVIYTYAKVQVLERWKGPDQASVEVAVPGGTAQGYRQSFPGSPQLIEGNEYLIFLWTSRSGLTQIIGLTQGIFDVAKDAGGVAMAVRASSNNAVVDPASGRAVRDVAIQMRLQDLSARITTTLQGSATR